MAECTQDERDLLDALKSAGVISRSEYSNNKGELLLYRWRLFSQGERSVIRHSLPDDDPYIMLDELEMVNWAVHGLPVSEITRKI